MQGALAVDQDWYPIYTEDGKLVALMIKSRYNSFVRHLYNAAATHHDPLGDIFMLCTGEFLVKLGQPIDEETPIARLRWKRTVRIVPEREHPQQAWFLMLTNSVPEFFTEPGVIDLRGEWV
jgi:hypothetical protein